MRGGHFPSPKDYYMGIWKCHLGVSAFQVTLLLEYCCYSWPIIGAPFPFHTSKPSCWDLYILWICILLLGAMPVSGMPSHWQCYPSSNNFRKFLILAPRAHLVPRGPQLNIQVLYSWHRFRQLLMQVSRLGQGISSLPTCPWCSTYASDRELLHSHMYNTGWHKSSSHGVSMVRSLVPNKENTNCKGIRFLPQARSVWSLLIYFELHLFRNQCSLTWLT